MPQTSKMTKEVSFCAPSDEEVINVPNIANIRTQVNLGKWILRYLFARLIDEELVRDENYRKVLSSSSATRRSNVSQSITIPSPKTTTWFNDTVEDDSLITPRAPNGNLKAAATPSLAIGVATPHPLPFNSATQPQTHSRASVDEGSKLEKKASQQSQQRASTERTRDYFSTGSNAQPPSENHARPSTPGEDSSEASAQSPVDADKEEKPKEGTLLFGKRFRMNFPKKLGRTSVEAKPVVTDERAEESDRSEDKEEKVIEDNFFGSIQKIRNEYEQQLQTDPSQILDSGVTPSLLSETPLLNPPLNTTIIIQEDQPDSGGVADLYRGTVGSVGRDADLIEKTGPMWLGDLLLKVCCCNQELVLPLTDSSQNPPPSKEISKVAFILLPYQDLLPSIASADG